uniref:Reverse transcriptase domain-containing protein n=1 Tax=Tanacetum cinerariifolium TaxID=118510 RepID=A0A699HHM2_TANCI|nr:reverse transcriptase domain-containing protein [Tanacetum cinerariifolium]
MTVAGGCALISRTNKACPQDCYALPEIDWKIESICGYPFKCFLDAYKGNHQIQMAESDEKKMDFCTSQGVYCYTKMQFSLKNAGATYQRWWTKLLTAKLAETYKYGSGAGLILTSPEGTEFTYALRFQFTASNNETEYEALIAGLQIAAQMGVRNVHIEELPLVLWAHRTIIKSSHGKTLFSLTYGTKAVILAEIRMPTYRTTVVDDVYNDEELRLNLDLLEERRERAVIREAKAKLKMTKYYNARVRGVTFKPGDFFYRSNDASHAVDEGKLGSKWERPYEATKALGDGAYKLRSIDGTVLPRTWNIANLKVLPLSHESCMDEFALQLGLVIK